MGDLIEGRRAASAPLESTALTERAGNMLAKVFVIRSWTFEIADDAW